MRKLLAVLLATALFPAVGWAQIIATVLDFGADPTGVADSAPAINAAAATGKEVRLPTGTYYVKSQISLSHGQCLAGSGDHSTWLKVDQGFSSTARGIIVLSGEEDRSPCVHDIGIRFAQPGNLTTTTTLAMAATGTTVTVASVANVAVNNYVTDATHADAVPKQTKVTNIAGNVVTLSNAVVAPGVSNGDTIYFGPSRANFATLAAGCTSGTGGTGCEYPPAIYDSAADRPRIWNLHVEGAWDGIDLVGNIVPWIENIEMGALNIGLNMDGGMDFSHIAHWHNWVFGSGAGGQMTYGLSQTYHDGTTIGWQIGREDGMSATDIDLLSSNLVITANASKSQAASQYSNVKLDGSDLVINGGTFNQFNNVYIVANPISTSAGITQTAGKTFINHLEMAVGGTNNGAALSGGILKVAGGYVTLGNGGVSAYTQTGGTIDLEDQYYNLPATLRVPVISSTNGTVIVKGNWAHPGTSGTAVSIGTANASNDISGNDFQQYGYSLASGSGGILKTYGTSLEYYNDSGTSVLSVGPTGALSTYSVTTQYGVTSNGHVRPSVNYSPSIASNACGSSTQGTISGTDQSMLVTVGTASVTSCTVTFGAAFTAAPRCTFSPANATAAAQGTTLAYLPAPSTTTLTIDGAALAGAAYEVLCQ